MINIVNTRTLLLTLLLLINNFIYSQKENIELPKGYGYEIKFSNNAITPLFSIYINKKGNVDFETIRIPVEKLGDSLFKYRMKLRPDLMPFLITLIHADKNTPYKYIDGVKSQMSSALLLNTIYRTGNIKDPSKGFLVKLHKSLLPTKKASINIGENDIIFSETIGLDPIGQMVEDLYSKNFQKVKESLPKFKYKTVRICGNKKIIINGKKIKLNNEGEITKSIEDTDFLYLFSEPQISYETYIKNYELLRKSYKKLKRYSTIIEISLELEKKLKEYKISL